MERAPPALPRARARSNADIAALTDRATAAEEDESGDPKPAAAKGSASAPEGEARPSNEEARELLYARWAAAELLPLAPAA